MRSYPTEFLRNIGIFAHSGAGKTSLTEALLYNTGVLSRMGRVEDGNTVSDYHPEEIKRKVTIHSSLVPCEWNNHKLNFIDTPGYADFIGEVKSVLKVVEGAIFVVCAASGVEIQTEVVWNLADNAGLPRFVFINKIDRENASFEKTLNQIREILSSKVVPLQIPIGEGENFKGYIDILKNKAYLFDGKSLKESAVPADYEDKVMEAWMQLTEAAAENDDELLMMYLDGAELTPEQVAFGLKKGVMAGKVYPLFVGSATKNIGIKDLLNAACELLPPPPKHYDHPVAYVFKTLADPYVGRINFVKVLGGALKPETTLYNFKKDKPEKIGHILYMRGKEQAQTEEVPAGDIACLIKLTETGTGDVLSLKDKPVEIEPIDYPTPNMTIAILPKSKNDEDRLSTALHRALEEDPTLRLEKNLETHQNLLSGMGELHLEIVLESIKRKFGVEVVTEELRVPYRETIRKTVQVEGKYKKQTGGRGQYGHVWLRLEPLPDKEFEFGEEIFGGAVPKQYFPAVEKGIREALNEGVLAGYKVMNVRAVLYDGSYHPVDSSEMAFKIAASQAFKKGVREANPVILEPIMEVEVTVPEQFMGDVISDFNGKRGHVLGMETQGRWAKVKAHVPYAEMLKYNIDLKAMTQARGFYTMTFSHYQEVPPKLQEEIIKKANLNKKEEE
ncbi:elongation factor G [Carboxydothermus pertinax]|uniref:Elongation factor G n=1 Tax=Carboxydothermus pertinax TaxID=870242 RepID=A0A1L8CUF7_9THEO|nr:elongation factor G [Carboxydothermus pertinax]GAV22527.1 elongation factor G [Carboxydothermus pertinax]